MFASLRFPSEPTEEQILSVREEDVAKIADGADLTPRQKDALHRYLCRLCTDPKILSYRADFAAELISSPTLQRVFSELSELSDLPGNLQGEAAAGETDRLHTVARFELFSARFDAFCKTLTGIVPESDGAKRCFRFLKTYEERFEYKELKHKANELLRAFEFDRGADCAVGSPEEEGSALLYHPSKPSGLQDTLQNVFAEFGLSAPEKSPVAVRPYSAAEAAVLTGVIRGNEDLSRRMEDFFTLYAACGTEDLFRLCDEATFFIAMNEIYRKGLDRGYSLCRPVFREVGFYTEIFGLNYTSDGGEPVASDYVTSPLNHVTVVCGPDSLSYLQAIYTAHLFASSGGLIFAQRAEIAPVNRIERDEKEQIRTEGLTEHGLCLCFKLFDVMLPRQEEAAVSEVILRLAECNVRSGIRICSKSNLTALQKKIDARQLPPCTLLQAGTDRTLEELLQRHNLTPEELEDDGNE